MIKPCLLSQHALELGVGKKRTRIIKELFQTLYFAIYVWVLYVIFSLNGIATANCCFAVTGNCPYFERLCNNFPFGTPEQESNDILNSPMCPPTK